MEEVGKKLRTKGLRVKSISSKSAKDGHIAVVDDRRLVLTTKNSFSVFSKNKTVDLVDIEDIRVGEARHAQLHEGTSISIVHGRNNKTVDIILDEDDNAQDVVAYLDFYSKLRKEEHEDTDPELRYLMSQFRKGDENDDNVLSFRETINLLKKINLNLPTKYVKNIYEDIDVEKTNGISFEQFHDLMSRIRRCDDLEAIFHMIKDETIITINPEDPLLGRRSFRAVDPGDRIEMEPLQKFMIEIQKEDIASEEQLRTFLPSLDMEDTANGLRYRVLHRLLTSEANELFNPPAEAEIYQDMNQPLAHYWIASSHNTYLTGDQLRSASAADRYAYALGKGCRCVEIDLWDGDDGNPVVYHGHTLTSKISAEEVVKNIQSYSFIASEYPVIISLENHCSIPQQEIFASYLKKYLGDILEVPMNRTFEELPSPESLKRKIILKGKKGSMKNAEEFDDEMNVEEEGEAPTMEELPMEDDPMASSKKVKVAPELEELVFLPGVKFKKFPDETPANRGSLLNLFNSANQLPPANEMSSFNEKKMDRLLIESPAAWVGYNKHQLTRTYPSGRRIDSSNYNPCPAWNVGAQIVALNYQKNDKYMMFNHGKFRDNGKAGYLLKPSFLRDKSINFDPNTGPFLNPAEYTVHIISGHQLPKPGNATRGEIIDPYVTVDIEGLSQDRASFRTKTINNNGFNPVWDTIFKFKINEPELALICFTVMDEDLDRDDFIGVSAMPVQCMRGGFRRVKLFDKDSTRRGDVSHAFLFVRVTINPLEG